MKIEMGKEASEQFLDDGPQWGSGFSLNCKKGKSGSEIIHGMVLCHPYLVKALCYKVIYYSFWSLNGFSFMFERNNPFTCIGLPKSHKLFIPKAQTHLKHGLQLFNFDPFFL
jgi:hypothetical protein